MRPLTWQNSEAIKKVLLKTPIFFCSQLKLDGTTLSSSELSVSLHPRKCTSFNDVQLLYDIVILIENRCHATFEVHLYRNQTQILLLSAGFSQNRSADHAVAGCTSSFRPAGTEHPGGVQRPRGVERQRVDGRGGRVEYSQEEDEGSLVFIF